MTASPNQNNFGILWPSQTEFLNSDTYITALFAGAGAGKCLHKQTLTLMYDGRVEEVQKVKVGDLLMGPDSTPRKVLEICRGTEPLFSVNPVKGDPFKVTLNHLLTLSRSWPKAKGQSKGDLIDVSVREWLSWSKSQKKQWKLVRTGVEFAPTAAQEQLPIDPYFLGVLLGDGCLTSVPGVTTIDDTIVQEVYRQAETWGLRVHVGHKSTTEAKTYSLSGVAGRKNPLSEALRKLEVFGHRAGSKFIPQMYKTANRATRLNVLAGLIDTDGSIVGTGYDYISKSETLARDVAFIARSCGMAAYVKKCTKFCQTGGGGTYWRVSISNAGELPARLKPIKNKRRQVKSVLHTGFDITPAEVGEYVGFVLDGDQRFVLGDFTITHNSKVLADRIVKDHSMHDGWWKDRIEFNTQPLILMVGAAHEAYLAENTVPLLRAAIDSAEDRAGRRLRKRTGRNRDGWYGSVGHRYQDMMNCTQIHIKSFPTKENAVAVTVAGLYFDEVTMFSDIEIWRRSLQRVRDPRAGKRPSGKTWDFVACVGTPEEDHWIRDALFDSTTGETFPGVNVIMDSSLSNPLLPDSWFINAGRHSSEIFKRMQIMGEWVKGAGGQRFAGIFDEKRHIVHLEQPRGAVGLQFDIGWDPGYRTGSVVIMWQHPRTSAWYVVDEIVIAGKTTNDVCSELISRGYHASKNNIRSICMDPRDNKKRSTSERTDGDIVFQRMGVRPKNKHIASGEGAVTVRLDALEDLLKTDRFFVSDKILPRSRDQLGLVNALHRFATEKTDENPEDFIDKPTRDTIQRWKHPIDAVHYVLMHYERGVYSRVTRNSSAAQVRRSRSGA